MTRRSWAHRLCALGLVAACGSDPPGSAGRPTCDALATACHDAHGLSEQAHACYELAMAATSTEAQCAAMQATCTAACSGAAGSGGSGGSGSGGSGRARAPALHGRSLRDPRLPDPRARTTRPLLALGADARLPSEEAATLGGGTPERSTRRRPSRRQARCPIRRATIVASSPPSCDGSRPRAPSAARPSRRPPGSRSSGSPNGAMRTRPPVRTSGRTLAIAPSGRTMARSGASTWASMRGSGSCRCSSASPSAAPHTSTPRSIASARRCLLVPLQKGKRCSAMVARGAPGRASAPDREP